MKTDIFLFNKKIEVTRKKVKNFILKIGNDSRIRVSAPLNSTDSQIKNFILKNQDWIEKKLNTPKLEVNSEKYIIILGKKRRKIFVDSNISKILLKENYIYFFKTPNTDKKKLFDIWANTTLNEILKKYLTKYLTLLNANIDHYTIKNMKSAWGIYHSQKKYISFNINLIFFEEEIIEYVVLHELCHIFYQNHQKEFWNFLKNYMPNYSAIRTKLRNESKNFIY